MQVYIKAHAAGLPHLHHNVDSIKLMLVIVYDQKELQGSLAALFRSIFKTFYSDIIAS